MRHIFATKKEQTQNIMITIEELQKMAADFLKLADDVNEMVSAYIDGSDKKEDEDAYNKVSEASVKFGKAWCEYWDEPFDHRLRDGFNYEIAEYILG